MRLLSLVALISSCTGSGTPGSLVETFDDDARIDAAATNARWEPGRVIGDVVVLAEPGSGADGALTTSKDGPLKPGTLELTEATIAHQMTVDGDLTLLVTGPLSIEPTGSLRASVAVEADANMHRVAVVTSVGLPLDGKATVEEVSVIADPLGDRPVLVTVSPSGAEGDFAEPGALSEALGEGWRYRAEIPHRLFDTAVLDELQVDYR